MILTPLIGRDFGMTSIKIALLDEQGNPRDIPNESGESTTPSAVHRSSDGSFLVGEDAIELGVVEPAGLVRNFKLDLASQESLIEGRRWRAVQRS